MKIIYKDGHVDECPQDQELHVIRHTAAHVMAQAIKRLYPEADFAFGPATENGFYYDVDLGDTKLTDEDLANIEKEMHKITKENLAIKPFILPRAEAVKLMEERHENYKVEHMADLADETEFSFFSNTPRTSSLNVSSSPAESRFTLAGPLIFSIYIALFKNRWFI